MLYFTTLGHLMKEKDSHVIPKDWIHGEWIYSPQTDLHGAKGQISGLNITAKQLIEQPLEDVREKILDLVVFLQDNFNVNLVQLGGLTTSVTSGGEWFIGKEKYRGFINHGDSYTAAATCKAVFRILELLKKHPSNLTVAIVGAYGIIGEAVSKMLVPKFKHSILVGRRENKLLELKKKLKGEVETTTELKIQDADIVITATNHPSALLYPHHLKKNAVVVDVSQPPNLSYEVCQQRPDVIRVDGGFVELPNDYDFQIPGIPKGKIFSCVAEVIMQALENERRNHVGAIILSHLQKTEKWAEKYGFILKELTNFGKPLVKTCR